MKKIEFSILICVLTFAGSAIAKIDFASSTTQSYSVTDEDCDKLSQIGVSLRSSKPDAKKLKEASELGQKCGAQVSEGCRTAAYTWAPTRLMPVDLEKCSQEHIQIADGQLVKVLNENGVAIYLVDPNTLKKIPLPAGWTTEQLKK